MAKRDSIVIIKQDAQDAVFKLGDALMCIKDGRKLRVEDCLYDAELLLKRALRRLEKI